jgi:hypothetical protein
MSQYYTNKILCSAVSLSLTALLLTACVSNETKDESSPFYSIPVHSTLKLNQPLTIAGGQVAIFVQEGKMISAGEIDIYNPNCKFEIYTMSDKPRTVNTDSFLITKVVNDIESTSLPGRAQPGASQLAVLNHALVAGMLDRGSMNYTTILYLHSERQKDVYRMSCQHWEDVVDDMYLSISEMRQAMGKVFTLELKQSTATVK